MATCFMIQPFDRDKFDKRYADTFEPAMSKAELEPYRVDRDPTSSIVTFELLCTKSFGASEVSGSLINR